ncbi:hypothetical protein BIV23_06930 [Streptomyces monashensis]|uniref:Amidohydrolase 3 domain-containing protein n=1 Tax=Streptomyces monashensis TaxID=1678012 RepID=A0A1S2QMM5_9ACTN|nr:hypothetical protein BIV23_06930 [Streptomyces monashensis]
MNSTGSCRPNAPRAAPPSHLARFLARTSGAAYDAISRLWINARHLSRHRPVLREQVLVVLDGLGAHANTALAAFAVLAARDGRISPRPFGLGSEIVCDADGRPTGLLLEDAACALVEAVAPRLTEAEVRARTAEVLHAMAASGLSRGHAMDANGDSLAVYAALESEAALPLRLRVAPWCRPEADGDAVAGLVRLQGTGGALWRVAGVKLFMDGTIDNGTAWLETPHCHRGLQGPAGGRGADRARLRPAHRAVPAAGGRGRRPPPPPRRSPAAPARPGPGPHSPLQALQGMTVNAAWAAGEEARAGEISAGHRADLTVLADDPPAAADTDLADPPVLLAAVGGRATYRGTDV